MNKKLMNRNFVKVITKGYLFVITVLYTKYFSYLPLIIILYSCMLNLIFFELVYCEDDRTLYEIMNDPEQSKNRTIIDKHGNKISYIGSNVYYEYGEGWGWEIRNGTKQSGDQEGAYAKSIIDETKPDGNATCETKPDTNQIISEAEALDNIRSISNVQFNKLLSDYFQVISQYDETEISTIVRTSLQYVKDVLPPSYWAQTEADIVNNDSPINLFMDTCTQKADIETPAEMATIMYFRASCTTYNIVNAMQVEENTVLCERLFKHAYEKLYESMN